MQRHRPSHEELSNKIREAKEAVADNHIAVMEPDVIAVDALELEYLVEDLSDVLSEVLREIGPEDYAGQKPPQRSYEEKIRGCELFAFAWESTLFRSKCYLKFALEHGLMWLVSFHRDRWRDGEDDETKGA